MNQIGLEKVCEMIIGGPVDWEGGPVDWGVWGGGEGGAWKTWGWEPDI